MKLQSFGIANFKAFGQDIQHVPLKPITLVFGPNSAGKSSLLHSLVWLREGFKGNSLDVHAPSDVEGIQLGGFDQLVHRHNAATMPYIGWSIHGFSMRQEVGGWNLWDNYRMEISFRKIQDDPKPAILTIANEDGIFFRASRKEADHWQIDVLDWEHPVMKAILTAGGVAAEDRLLRHFRITQADPNAHLNLIYQEMLPSRLEPAANESNWVFADALPKAFRALFDAFADAIVFSLRNLTAVPPLRTLPERGFDPLRSDRVWRTIATHSAVRDQLNKWLGNKKRFDTPYHIEVLRYLREDAIQRQMPEAIRASISGWLAKLNEGDADFFLAQARQRWEQTSRCAYARRCPEFWKDVVDHMYDIAADDPPFDIEDWDALSEEEKRSAAEELAEGYIGVDVDFWSDRTEPFELFLHEDAEFQEFLSKHLDESHIAARLLDQSSEELTKSRAALMLRDLRTNTIVGFQDVGVGISQVIPVVANAFGLRDTLISIEQPEIHIHPRLQAELGDVFIESALGENQNTFLLETHSEHLILRILRRIRETTEGDIDDWPEDLKKTCPNGIRPVDVAVLYVEPGEDGAKVVELPVTPDGDFSKPWPAGFFTERAKELY